MLGVLVLVGVLGALFFNQRGVPIFLFHQINEKSDTTPEVFEQMLQEIVRKKLTPLTASQLEAYETVGKIPLKSILLTFDDGYEDIYQVVFPLLKKYQLSITLFLNTKYIASEVSERYCLNGNRYLIWSEIHEMIESGVLDIQRHTHAHQFHFTSLICEGRVGDHLQDQERDNLMALYEDSFHSGVPILKKRGEFSQRGYYLNRERVNILKNQEYEPLLKHPLECFQQESQEVFQERIHQEYLKQEEEFQQQNIRNSRHFAWPWGHYTKEAIAAFQAEGIRYFYTCKKGVNKRRLNKKAIRRDSFRRATLRLFRIKLYLNRNQLLGELYAWLS